MSKPLASSISTSRSRDIKLGEVLNKLLEMLRNNHLRMKGNFYLGIKALTQVEDIGRSLNPDLNFVKLGEPYAMRQIEGKYHPTPNPFPCPEAFRRRP